MVRTNAEKLLVGDGGRTSLFFNLAEDPMELDNLAGRPGHVDAMEELAKRLSDTVLFDAPSPNYAVNRSETHSKGSPGVVADGKQALQEWTHMKYRSSR